MNKQNRFLSLAGLLLLLVCAGCGADSRTESSGTETAEKYTLPLYFPHDAETEPDLAFVKAFAEEIRKTYNEAYEGYWKLEDLEIEITNIDTESDTYYVRAYGNSESVCGHAEQPFMKGMYQALKVFETEEEKAWAKEKIVEWIWEVERREVLPDEYLSQSFKNSYKVTGSLEQGFEIFYMKKSEWLPLEEEFSREDYEAGYERGYHELLRVTEYFHPTWEAPLPEGFTYTAKFNGDLLNGKYSGEVYYQGELCGSVSWIRLRVEEWQGSWVISPTLLVKGYEREGDKCRLLGTWKSDPFVCHMIERRNLFSDENALTEEDFEKMAYIMVFEKADDIWGWEFTIQENLCDEEGIAKVLDLIATAE